MDLATVKAMNLTYLTFYDFENELRDHSVKKDDPSPHSGVYRDSDGKWILNNLASRYGINDPNRMHKSRLIDEILFEEKLQKLITIKERTLKTSKDDYSIKSVSKQSNFKPYSVTIDINTRSFHDKLLEALYELELYSDEEIVEFSEQLQNKMRNAPTG